MNRRSLFIALILTAVIACGMLVRHYRGAARRTSAWNQQQADESLYAALAKPIALRSGYQTLADFAVAFAEKAGTAVIIDDEVVDPFDPSARFSPKAAQIEVPRHSLPAASHLSLAAKQLDLCWFIRRGQIVITTPEIASNQPLIVVTYPLAGFGDLADDSSSWVAAIEGAMEPDSWTGRGGQGRCEPVPGALVIAQRPDVHRQIRVLFDHLKAQRDPLRTWQPVSIWPDSADEANAGVLARLQRPASIDCRDKSLGELVEFLSVQHEIPLILNLKKLEEASVSPTTPITQKLSEMTLGSLLVHVLKELELTYVVRDGVLQITTPEDAERQLPIVAYPVHDLITTPSLGPNDARFRDYTELIDLLVSEIRPDSWGFSGPAQLDYIGGWLLIPQTHLVHDDIERLLCDLRRALNSTAAPAVFATPNKSASDARIFAALDQPLEISYSDVPLSRICDDLSNKLAIPVYISLKKFAEASIAPDVQITGAYASAPARLQLARLLEPLRLAFAIRDEAVVITTPEDAESQLMTHVYDIRSLFETDVSMFPSGNHDRLIELIENHLRPSSWDRVGGPGSIEVFRGLLVVSQSSEVHDQIKSLLAELHRAIQWPPNETVAPQAITTDDLPTLLTRIYDVRSLMKGDPLSLHSDLPLATGTSLSATPADALIQLITTRIAPNSWSDVGGSAQINCLPGILIVSQTRQNHQALESLLHQLRTTGNIPTAP